MAAKAHCAQPRWPPHPGARSPSCCAQARRTSPRPEIFETFPDHVERDGELLTLRQWHDTDLRELCFSELFGRWRTRVSRLMLSASLRRLGVPSADAATLPRS